MPTSVSEGLSVAAGFGDGRYGNYSRVAESNQFKLNISVLCDGWSH